MEAFADDPIDSDLTEAAALCHDLGHPPFGHAGEAALNACMADFGGFEGNAQTLRLVTKLETAELKEGRAIGDVVGEAEKAGLNLTYRTIGSTIKYDNLIPCTQRIPEAQSPGPCKKEKGYYKQEEPLVRICKEKLGASSRLKVFPTLEGSVMDCADDIAYCLSDLDDCFKTRYLDPLMVASESSELLSRVAQEVSRTPEIGLISSKDVLNILMDVFNEVFEGAEVREDSSAVESAIGVYRRSASLVRHGWFRHAFRIKLLNLFLNGLTVEFNRQAPALSRVKFNARTLTKIEVLKKFLFKKVTSGPEIQVLQYQAHQIVSELFGALKDGKGRGIFPEARAEYIDSYRSSDGQKFHRAICDYIADMTDGYAVEIFGRLHSHGRQTIYKPLY